MSDLKEENNAEQSKMSIPFLPAQNVETLQLIRPDMLKLAAQAGNVNFMKQCVSIQMPYNYYLTPFEDGENLLHIAIREDRTEFVKEMLNSLHPQVIHQLMLYKTMSLLQNPLHMAAFKGNIEAVKLFLNFYRSLPSSSSSSLLKPWLDTDVAHQTPFHTAVFYSKEDCALEILNMDIALFTLMVDKDGNGLLFTAVTNELYDVAKKILECSPSSTWTGPYSPLHILPKKSDRQDIFRLLLEKAPHLVRHTNNDGVNILHKWAGYGKVWPYDYIIRNCNDIIPNIRSIVVNLMSTTEMRSGWNPFHFLAACAPEQNDAVAITDILIRTYRQEVAQVQPGQYQPPWLGPDRQGRTPLRICLALDRKFQKLALHIWSEEKEALMHEQGNILVHAISNGCQEFAEKILSSVDTEKWTELKDIYNCNALHVAPYCEKTLLERLVNGNPKLLEGIDTSGRTILHRWVVIGNVWSLEYILQECGTNHPEWKSKLFPLLGKSDISGNTVIHYVVCNIQERTKSILQLLASAFKEFDPSWNTNLRPEFLPWIKLNESGEGALHVAFSSQCQEEVALTILSLSDGVVDYHQLLDYYRPHHKILFLAMEKNFYEVARYIMEKLGKQQWEKYVKDPSNEKNILHLALTHKGKAFAIWLVKEASDLVVEQDKDKKTPLEIACDESADWIIRDMLKATDPTLIFEKAPLAWIGLCKNGQISTLLEFIECCPGDFRDHCVKHKASPLHHMKHLDKASYEKILNNQNMKNIVDIQDSQGATPLHIAIQEKNINLTKVLLDIEDVSLDIKNNDKKTARSLLEEISKEDQNWNNICQDYGINFSVKMKNLLEARNTFSVVAALLATITFTAGFTLPGGFNQVTGEAILTKKAAFLVFLISDTIALCSSMLVLTCLILSIIYDRYKAKTLIDRSMKLLMVSLYCTMIAFMCGVFIVISQKSMWAAIVVIIICSLLGVSARKSLLYTLVDKLIPSPNSNCKDRFCQLEMGKVCCCRGDSSRLKCN